jgi:RimJ/RimL family protein N-acetyltransferase
VILRPDLPIYTARLILRALDPTDARALLSYHGLTEVHRFLPTPAMNEAGVSGRLEHGRWSRSTVDKEGDSIFLGVQLRDQPGLIGDVMVHWRSEQHQTAEIGYVFHPKYCGYGYATEAGRAALTLAFVGLDAHRVVAYIDPRNGGSTRVAERLGMSPDGLMRENKLIEGERRSELVYAVLRHEWNDG